MNGKVNTILKRWILETEQKFFWSSGDCHLIGYIWLDAVSDSHLWLLAAKCTRPVLHQFLCKSRCIQQDLLHSGVALNLSFLFSNCECRISCVRGRGMWFLEQGCSGMGLRALSSSSAVSLSVPLLLMSAQNFTSASTWLLAKKRKVETLQISQWHY